MQLNKFMALCGVASRRKANTIIAENRITVNGETVKKLGFAVDPAEDTVCLDGRQLAIPASYRYVLLNKPAGSITSVLDGRGRTTVLDLVGADERLFPVGRLDLDTEGVLLITNDGDLAYRLAHPRFGVRKVYEAWVEGSVGEDAIHALQRGVEIDPGVCVRGEARVLRCRNQESLVEIQVHEGKKRQIKRMMKAVSHPVRKLSRTHFAGLTVDGLKPGEWRELTRDEVDALYRLTGLSAMGGTPAQIPDGRKTGLK